MKTLFILVHLTIVIYQLSLAQNIGIGTNIPAARLHIKGNADTSQLVIEAHSTQDNRRPLIRLRKSDGSDLLWIHSDDFTNVFIGKNAGRSNNAFGGAKGNTFTGSDAGYSNTTGFNNTASGHEALRNNTSGTNNTATGRYALLLNSFGGSNTATGSFTLTNNTTGIQNTALGVSALYFNTNGNHNTAIGFEALVLNTTGVDNTSTGYGALRNNSTGSYNASLGYRSLYNTTASQYNTAVGYAAGDSYDNGYNNVFVGANTDVNGPGYYNVIAMGQGTIVGAVSTARFGNSATVSYGGWANWTNVSDGRYKKNVQENVPGLSFIMKLRPVTYNLMAAKLSKDLGEYYKETGKQMQKVLAEKEKIIQSGFVAQEVEAAAKELGYNFSGIDKPQNDKGQYGLRYAEFVVPLVKAVQELNLKMVEFENLKMENAAMKKQLTEIIALLKNK